MIPCESRLVDPVIRVVSVGLSPLFRGSSPRLFMVRHFRAKMAEGSSLFNLRGLEKHQGNRHLQLQEVPFLVAHTDVDGYSSGSGVLHIGVFLC